MTHYGYDPNCGCSGRQAFITNALGQVTQRSYDENANETAMTDALGRTTTFLYDELDRRTYTIFADGSWSLTSYDAIGRRIAETDQSTNTTWFAYDALGRLTAVTNALGKVTSYAYDEVGSLTAQTDANGHTTTYEYDSMGRRVKRTLPGLQVETYAYDLAGNLTNKVDFNGRSTVYSYDAMNRLLSKTPDAVFNAAPVMFGYDGLGQRTNMVDASGATAYTYDVRNRLSQKLKTWAGVGLAVALNYAYDGAGNVTNIASSSVNGTETSYTYDALNRLETVADAHTGVTSYGYDAVGNLQGYVYPNNVSTIYSYDLLNRLTNVAALNPLTTAIQNYAYQLKPTGHRASVAELGGRSVSYSYDNTYRLTAENVSGAAVSGTVTYSLDDVGNRLQRASTLAGVGSASSGFDANDRLTSDNYDSNGNTTQSGGNSDLYDFEDRLVSRNNGHVLIAYDGDGNRVAETVNGTTTLYVVDDRNPSGYAQVLEELVVSGTPEVARAYVYGADLISQEQVISNVWVLSFYGYDGHGNVRYLTDLNGNVTDTYDYDAFGTLIAQSTIFQTPTPNSYLYCGEQFDADLGLYYNRARYLNADSGRFWTRDVFEGVPSDPISLHKYLYAHADPVNLVDRSGNSPITEFQFGQLVQNTLRTGARLNLRVVVQKSGCILMYAAAEEVVGQGIYLFLGETGTPYVGKTGRAFAKRLTEHLRSGALRNLDKVLGFVGVDGAARRVALRDIEQYVLNTVLKVQGRPGGLKGVQNKINPVREILRKTVKFCP